MSRERGKGMMKYQLLRLSGRTVIYILIIVGVVITLFPILWMISTSFKPVDALFNMPPEWVPKNPTIQSFRNLFKPGSFFLKYFVNSFIVCASATLVTVFVASLAGYAFSRFRFRGSRFAMFIILVSQMFPIVMLLISIFTLFLKLRLINTYPALLLTYTGFALPFSVWMLKNYFDTLPREIEEAAYIDGCDRFRVLTKIVYPVTGPAILSVALFVFLVGWNELMYALTLTNTDTMRTIPPGLVVTYQGQYQVYWSEMMAASLLVSIPIILLFIFMQRYFIQGMTMGAVKE
jgi:multiple sugar transport system permease protein